MAKMMLDPIRLTALLEPLGFSLVYADSFTKNISFVRSSHIPRLFEHLFVGGGGKKGEAVSAQTSISGAFFITFDECVAERDDNALLFELGTDRSHHWTIVNNRDEAMAWEKKLANVADFHCRRTANMSGPALSDRLQSAFSARDRYVEKIGNATDVFDSEFAYFENSPLDQKQLASRLHAMGSVSIGLSDDFKLACLVVAKFGSEVEGRENPYGKSKWHEDATLRTRVYMLVDFFTQERKRYQNR